MLLGDAVSLLLSCGLIPSAIRISGGTSGAVSLARRVEGTANIVGTRKPGDGPCLPAEWHATGVPPFGARGTIAESYCRSSGGTAQALNTVEKLLSFRKV